MRKFVRYLFSAQILCTFNGHTVKPRCTSMTHTFIFLNLVRVNAAICRGYYGAVNQTRFAWTVIYCTDLLHLTALTLTRYVINQVCGIDGHIGLSVWHWMNINNHKSQKRYLQISNSYKSSIFIYANLLNTDNLILFCMSKFWVLYILQ